MSTTAAMDSLDSIPSLPLTDRVFLGEGLFETLRVEQGQACHSALHWQRLSHWAAALGMTFDLSLPAWQERLQSHLDAKGLCEGGMKVILTGGAADRGLLTKGEGGQLLIQSFAFSQDDKPLNLMTALWRRDAKNPLYQFKSVNYLEAILARRQAASAGFDEVLFLNTQQHLTETSVANLFIIRQGQVITPPLSDGLLAGITRRRLIEHCLLKGIACIEQSLTPKDLELAEVVFLTNSLQGLIRAQSLDHQPLQMRSSLFDALLDGFV